MEFWSALVGAIVGGAATFSASWWQTGRMLQHERDMAREAAAEERRSSRAALGASAAAEMLSSLADFLSWRTRARDFMTVSEWQMFARSIADMYALAVSRAPLAGEEVNRRWTALVSIADELRKRRVVPAPDPERYEWTHETKRRAVIDTMRYGDYVKESLVAHLDEKPCPPWLDPPILAREDLAVWNWAPPSKQ